MFCISLSQPFLTQISIFLTNKKKTKKKESIHQYTHLLFDACIASNWIIRLSTVCTTQEPLSGFIIVWNRLAEGSGSHMAWSEAINEGLNGLM